MSSTDFRTLASVDRGREPILLLFFEVVWKPCYSFVWQVPCVFIFLSRDPLSF